jgi:molybdate transport system ATP-binding protein
LVVVEALVKQPSELCSARFRELPSSYQRLVLLLRAFVKKPPLLILDEPFQGMEEAMVTKAREYLETEISDEKAVVMVTHFVGEEASRGRWGPVIKLSEGGTIEEIV